MLTIEIGINEKIISRARIVNMQRMGDGKYLYHVEYAQLDKEQKKLNFEIIHDREDGAEGLALLIYQEIFERLK